MANPIRIAAATGRPTFGPWCSIPSGVTAEVLGKTGFDWVLVDLQHGGTTLDTLLPVLQAVELGGSTAVVRVPWNEPSVVMRVLDLGATAVIVPMVNNADDARIAAQAMRYPPAGNRSYGPVRGGYLSPADADDDVVCLVMIETAEGLANVESIAAVPGIDGLFVGPVDLALALGEGPDFTGMRPSVLAAVDQVVAAARRHGVIPGGVAMSVEHAEDLLRRGMRFLTYGADGQFLRAGATAAAATIASLQSGFSAGDDAA
jgi:4-hydroxy-2-oxoheptanedioate aldolase